MTIKEALKIISHNYDLIPMEEINFKIYKKCEIDEFIIYKNIKSNYHLSFFFEEYIDNWSYFQKELTEKQVIKIAKMIKLKVFL